MADSLASLDRDSEAQTLEYQQGMERANKQLEQFGSKQKSLLIDGGRRLQVVQSRRS